MILENIKSPEDIKHLSHIQLKELSSEIRSDIISTVAANGGHLASNLGVVELTIALHRVFDSPKDAIVWDVSHQCYTHKLLTGRYKDFGTLRQGNGISGFTKACESPHDFFDNGHASTSISQALGLLTARKLKNDDSKVIAVIGDGALTGGLAFEGLCNAGLISKDLIVILNDNQMSISPNDGTLSRYLSRLTMSSSYQSFRHGIDHFISHIPFVNKVLTKFVFRLKRGLKGLFLSNNLFVDLGFEYAGPLDGHDIKEMELVFRRVKQLNKPAVIHVVTRKGKGYRAAEDNPEQFHGIGPFCISDGKSEESNSRSFTGAFSQAISGLAEKNNDVTAITAAMAKGTGLASFQRKFSDRFFDVGIAEEHAVTFASGLAKGGLVPFVCIYSTFIQRSVDQIIHDVALPDLHVIIVLDRSGAVANDGETHQGVFDIALLKNIPNVTYLAPASEKELCLCTEYAYSCKGPVIIRYPKKNVPDEVPEFAEPLSKGKGVLIRGKSLAPSFETGKERVLVMITGGMYSEAAEAVRHLVSQNITADIYDLRFIHPLDRNSITELASGYDGVVIAEDGILSGGIGMEIKEILLEAGYSSVSVMAFPDRFMAQGSRNQIIENAFLSGADIERECLKLLNIRKFC